MVIWQLSSSVSYSNEIESVSLSRRKFILGAGAALLGAGLPRVWGASPVWPLSALIIGDSMALCGFGQRLDGYLRSMGVVDVFTYMACGTQPLSWTTLKAYANAKTRCGFWKIETQKGAAPLSFQDTYGMSRGHRPNKYDVPKIEMLLESQKPDILIVQLGNNLFDLLKGNNYSRMGPMLQPYIAPFLSKVAHSAGAPKRVYWVSPPETERIARTAHDILVERLRATEGDWLKVIDSRLLLKYPYRNLQPDKQHFFGPDAVIWADSVFDIIKKDLEAAPLASSIAPTNLLPPPPPAPTPAEVAKSAPPAPTRPSLYIKASLEYITAPFSKEEIAPYNESLVGFVYRVRYVMQGEFKGTHLVVLHAAHIDGKRQSLSGYYINQTRRMRLIPLEDTPWATLKAKDDPRFVDMERFISEEDNIKLSKQM